MRHTIFLPLVLLAGIRLIAQRPEFIHPEFLDSQFAVSEDAPSKVVVAGKDEPGDVASKSAGCRRRAQDFVSAQ